jgi:hypothetical protein
MTHVLMACVRNPVTRRWFVPPNAFMTGYGGVRLTSQNCGWLRWGETDVSELRSVQACCSSPGDCDVDHGMTILTEANSQLVYQSALAVPSTGWRSCQQRHLWSEWAKKLSILSVRPCGTSRDLLHAVKS